jgi:hypothetical protein
MRKKERKRGRKTKSNFLGRKVESKKERKKERNNVMEDRRRW